MARPTGRPLRDELLAAATARIQKVGINSLSYGDLAKELGIKAPSIHHHFRKKEDLLTAVAAKYRSDFRQSVDAIDETSPRNNIEAYANLFTITARQDRFCLCGALAAEWQTAGDRPRAEVKAFFDDQLSWLANQIENGIQKQEFPSHLKPADTAQVLLTSLEGALLLARTGHPTNTPDSVTQSLLTILGAGQPTEKT